MKLNIPYGKDGSIPLELPDARVAAVVEANPVEVGDESRTLSQALQNPIDSVSFRAFVEDARDLLILVNDGTRPTPTARVLDILVDDLAGVDLRFLVATGIHRAPTEDEYRQIFGHHLERFRDRIFAHDARADEEMVFVGRSSNGTEMRINRLGVEAHKIAIISSVEPHYFAGYTGGRKSFLPGIAAYDTITQNHKLALRPEARALALAGNPVHEDMVDALQSVKKEIFAINTVLDRDHRIYAAAAGDIHASLTVATEKARKVFAAPIAKKAAVVVSVVKCPGDIDLYQAQKGIDNAKHALREGGILILVAQCRDGIGEQTFFDLLASASSPAEALQQIDHHYVLGYHKAAKMAEVGQWAQMWAVTDLAEGLLEQISIRSFRTLPVAIDQALAEAGESAQVLFLLDGGLIVPQVENTK